MRRSALPSLNGLPFVGRGLFEDGTPLFPAAGFAAERTGFYRRAAGQIGVTIGGAAACYFTGNGLASANAGDAAKFLRGDGTWQVGGGGGAFAGFDDGTVLAPGAFFSLEPSLGFYRPSAGFIEQVIGGVRNFRFTANGTLTGAGAGFLTLGADGSVIVSPNTGSTFQVNQVSRGSDGSSASPGWSFFNDPDTGLYRVGPNGVGFAAGGAIVGGWDSLGLYGGNGASGSSMLSAAAGSAAAPCFSFRGDTDTGIFASGSNEIAFFAGGTSRVYVNGNGLMVNSGAIGLTLASGRILRLGNAYVAGAPGAATGTLTVQDSTGTTYRIPVLV